VVLKALAASERLSPPRTTASTMASRPLGVRRALLWTFIRSPGVKLVCRNFSFPGSDRMNNLLKVHT